MSEAVTYNSVAIYNIVQYKWKFKSDTRSHLDCFSLKYTGLFKVPCYQKIR